MLKKCLILLLIAASSVPGCVKGPTSPHSSWPWGRDNSYERAQTGGYIEASANVAEFGAAPEAVKPATAEILVPAKALAATAPETPLLAAATANPSETVGGKAGATSFMLSDIPVLPSSYLSQGADGISRDITADNPEKAPVSVAIVLDPSSHNVAGNKDFPVFAVVEPGAKETVLRLKPKNRNDRFDYRYRYTWTIGDYRATHRCNEGYQFPFPATARATASTTSGNGANEPQQHIIFFLVPKGTPVLPARKGVVVQIKTGKVDILHDDGTVATYGHIGKVAEGLAVGKVVSTDEAIGVAARLGKEEQGYLELSVWAPRLPVTPSPGAARPAGFDFVSFPLNFCSAGWSHCRAVKDGEVVSRNSATAKQNQRKRGTRRPASGEH